MKCRKCGTLIPEGSIICPNCGEKAEFNGNSKKIKFLPSFILGLIASLFGISGGICMTMCTSLYSSGWATFILILGGSIVGLIGACKCLSNAIVGSVLQLIAAVMIIICAYGITGSEMSTVVAMLLFLISGGIGLIYGIIKSRK